MTFLWFVKERYIPMRRGSWSPTYKRTNTYNLEHYLIGHFGDMPLRNLSTFEIQVWLNNRVEQKDYSDSVVRSASTTSARSPIWRGSKSSLPKTLERTSPCRSRKFPRSR